MLALVIGNTTHNRVRNHPLLPAANPKQALEEVKRLTRLHLSTRGAFDFELEGTVPVLIAFLGTGSVGENRLNLERGRDRDYIDVLGKAGVLAAFTVDDLVGHHEDDLSDFANWLLSSLSDHVEINEGPEPDGAFIIKLEELDGEYVERCVFTSPAAQYWVAPEGYWLQGVDRDASDLDMAGDIDLDASQEDTPVVSEGAQADSDTLRTDDEVQPTTENGAINMNTTNTENATMQHTVAEAMSALRKNADTLIEIGLIKDALGLNARLSEVKVLNTLIGMMDLEPSMADFIRANAPVIADKFKAIDLLMAEQAADMSSDIDQGDIIPVVQVSADPLGIADLDVAAKPAGASVQRRADADDAEHAVGETEDFTDEEDLSNEFDMAEAEAEAESALDGEVMHYNVNELINNDNTDYVTEDNAGDVACALLNFIEAAMAELREVGDVDVDSLMSEEDLAEARDGSINDLTQLIRDTDLLDLVSEDLLTEFDDQLVAAYSGEDGEVEADEEHDDTPVSARTDLAADDEGDEGDEEGDDDYGIHGTRDLSQMAAVPSSLVTVVPRLVVNVVLPSHGPLSRLSGDTLRSLNTVVGDDGVTYDLATGLTKSRTPDAPNGFYRKPFNTLARTLSRLAGATVVVPMTADELADNQDAAVNFVAEHVSNVDVEGALTGALARLSTLPSDEDGNLIVGFSGEGEDGIPVNSLMSLDKSVDLIDNDGSFNVELTVTLSFVAPGYRNLRDFAALARSLIKMCANAANSTGLSIHPAITYSGVDAYLGEDDPASAAVNEIVSAMYGEVVEFGNAPTSIYNAARMSSLRTAVSDASAFKVYLQGEDGEIVVATCGDDGIEGRTLNAMSDAAAIGTFDPEGSALYALGGDNTITLFTITEDNGDGDEDDSMEMEGE